MNAETGWDESMWNIVGIRNEVGIDAHIRPVLKEGLMPENTGVLGYEN